MLEQEAHPSFLDDLRGPFQPEWFYERKYKSICSPLKMEMHNNIYLY